jgi:hypothetical protein
MANAGGNRLTPIGLAKLSLLSFHLPSRAIDRTAFLLPPQICPHRYLLSHHVISSEARNLAVLERDFAVRTAHLEMTG